MSTTTVLASQDDGRPAFPTQNGCRSDSGMSLRDWFAGMALSAMDYGWFGSPTRIRETAEECYNIADAMLAARKGDV